MKHSLILFLFFSFGLLTGCIGDDLDACDPRFDLTLHFDYSQAPFPSRIHKVNVGVLDVSTGLTVWTKEVDPSLLATFQGVRLTLPRGEYEAICWGNAFEQTQINGFGRGECPEDGSVHHPNYETVHPIPSNDSLYHGKQSFTVPDTLVANTHTVPFQPAHIKLRVYVNGLSHQFEDRDAMDRLLIRVDSVSPVYTHDRVCTNALADYQPAISIDPDFDQALAPCDVFRFDALNPITIRCFKDREGNDTLRTVKLQDHIRKYGIPITSDNEVLIPIHINCYGDSTVTVTLHPWEGVPVDPDL